MPINEAGRNLTAAIAVGAAGDRSTRRRTVRRAYRVEPRLTRASQRRRPVDATIWLSADERRVPLAADVAAGFGRVRLKLVDYRP